jgi:hypothetical protein
VNRINNLVEVLKSVYGNSPDLVRHLDSVKQSLKEGEFQTAYSDFYFFAPTVRHTRFLPSPNLSRDVEEALELLYHLSIGSPLDRIDELQRFEEEIYQRIVNAYIGWMEVYLQETQPEIKTWTSVLTRLLKGFPAELSQAPPEAFYNYLPVTSGRGDPIEKIVTNIFDRSGLYDPRLQRSVLERMIQLLTKKASGRGEARQDEATEIGNDLVKDIESGEKSRHVVNTLQVVRAVVEQLGNMKPNLKYREVWIYPMRKSGNEVWMFSDWKQTGRFRWKPISEVREDYQEMLIMEVKDGQEESEIALGEDVLHLDQKRGIGIEPMPLSNGHQKIAGDLEALEEMLNKKLRPDVSYHYEMEWHPEARQIHIRIRVETETEPSRYRPETRVWNVARGVVNYFRSGDSGRDTWPEEGIVRLSDRIGRVARLTGAEEFAEAVEALAWVVERKWLELKQNARASQEELARQEELMETFLWWVREIVLPALKGKAKEGVVGLGLDGSPEERRHLESALERLGEERGRFVAFVGRDLGALNGEGFHAVVPNVDFERFRPLYRIRQSGIENADRLPRILGNDGAAALEGNLNRFIFSVASRGKIAGLDSGLEGMIRYLSQVAVGTVTSSEMEALEDLKEKPDEIKERVFTVLFQVDRYPDLRNGRAFQIEGGSVTLDLPLLAQLIASLRAREAARQSA